ncbi:MAG: fimbrillin family protein [Bacteroidales bacterium]|nr:fimbrillin family protein [Bacteroidales bacterium]
MFKKIFTIAAAAVVVAGCGKETVSVKDGASQLKPIAFTSYTQGEVKADVTSDNLSSIYVLADTTITGATAKYFNEEISKTDGKWTSSAYWPSSGTMDFYASNKAVSDGSVVTVTAVTEDVVVAKATGITCPQTAAVSLTFSHIFAKLAVTAKVKDAALKATIYKIEVVAKAPASYDVAAAENNWTLAETASPETYMSSETGTAFAATDAAGVTLSKEYVAPQGGVSIKVYYKVTSADGKTTYVDKTETKGPATIENLTFTAGQKHTLNLTFDATKISFSTSVNAFTDGTSTNQDL